MVTLNFVFNYRKEFKLENTVDKIKIKPKPTVTAVIGGAWEDEGKGKIALREAKDASLVIRGNGGANAGHTVVFEGKKIVMDIISFSSNAYNCRTIKASDRIDLQRGKIFKSAKKSQNQILWKK